MQSRILVADKDPVICGLLFRTLKDGGYDIDVVHRGEDALQCLSSQEAPRLALVDWAMPGLPGTEVCRSLRKTPSGLDAYVFLIWGVPSFSWPDFLGLSPSLSPVTKARTLPGSAAARPPTARMLPSATPTALAACTESPRTSTTPAAAGSGCASSSCSP